MIGRRIVPLVVTAFAALPLTALSAAAAQAPVDVVLGEPKCASPAAEDALEQFGASKDVAEAATRPTVSYELRGKEAAGNPTPFRIDVNGETRATGAVGGRGVVRGSFALPSKRTHVRVVSGDQVLAERVYEVRC
jgi:hypothetical protein